jgi:hypothetical protein
MPSRIKSKGVGVIKNKGVGVIYLNDTDPFIPDLSRIRLQGIGFALYSREMGDTAAMLQLRNAQPACRPDLCGAFGYRAFELTDGQ